jgi:hypothetical protein
MSETPRRPSPTSRARRIGGRPVPRPDAAPEQRDLPGQREFPVAPVTLAKPVSADEPVVVPVSAPDESPRRGIAAWIPAGVLGVAVVTLLVFLVVASHGVYWAKPSDSASARAVPQEQVLASVKKCFAQINTYDYRKLDGLVQKDLACTTGTFTTDLRRALQTQILRLAPKVKATQTAQINRAGIASVSPSGDQVVALIYGQLSQSNTKTAKASPRVDVVGAVVTVDNVHGTWLISKVANDTGS